MVTNQILNSPLSRPLSSPFLGTALWKTAGDRVVSILTKNKLGLTALGLATGVATVMAVDFAFLQKRNSLYHRFSWNLNSIPEEQFYDSNGISLLEKHLNDRIKTISLCALLTVGIITLPIAHFNKDYYAFPFLALGTIAGVAIDEYYNKNSDCKIDAFIKWLKELKTDHFYKLDLSYFHDYLKYYNLENLGSKLYENLNHQGTLKLMGCKLTDNDLKKLTDAGWFNNKFTRLRISQNPQITAQGLKYVAEHGNITFLGLTGTDLTDNDLIEMSDSGYFSRLDILKIGRNPRITGKGLAYIAQKGFENLKVLDLSENSQLFGQGLDEWIEKDGFKNLEILNISRTDVTEQDLEKMIDKFSWMRNLICLVMEFCPKLEKLPPNILQLTQLKNRGLALYNTMFNGTNFKVTKEVAELGNAGKIKLSRFRLSRVTGNYQLFHNMPK